MTLDKFFTDVYLFLENGKVDSALDYLYEQTHNKMRKGDLSFTESIFNDKRIREIDPQIGISLLAISLPWRKYILSRTQYLLDLERILISTIGEKESEDILIGLR